VLARNPSYFREGFPLLDRVVVRIVPDATSLLTQLLSGSIDYMEGVAPREEKRAREGAGAGVIPFDYPMYDYIGWNGSPAAVRRPRGAAGDDACHRSQGDRRRPPVRVRPVSSGPVLSFWWGANREIKPWPYDPAEAKRILESRGSGRGPGTAYWCATATRSSSRS